VKKLKKFLIILFLFLDYNSAYSVLKEVEKINSSQLVNLFKDYVENPENNDENFQNNFQPRELILIPTEDSKVSIEFDLLLTTLKNYLHPIDHLNRFDYDNKGNKNSFTEIITNQIKEYLLQKINNLNFNTKNEDIVNEAKKLADAFQNYIQSNINVEGSKDAWKNIASIIFPDKRISIRYSNIAEMIKNYFTLETLEKTQNEIAFNVLEKLKDFFSKEIKDFNVKNIFFNLNLDIFKLFVSTGDIKAIFLAFMLQTQKNLKILDLSNNKISDFGMKVFSIALINESNLNTLNLSNNAIGNIGIKALQKATEDKNFKLPEKLILINNKITGDVEKELIPIIEHAIYKHNINKNFFFILKISKNYISFKTIHEIITLIRFNYLNNSDSLIFKNVTLEF